MKPDSSVTSREMKTYSESRIELRNLQMLKKMLEKSSQFLSSEQPCEPKSLDVALKIAGVKKIPLENLGCSQPRGHFIQIFNERSVNDIRDFCLLWFSNQFDIVSATHLSCDTVGRELWLAIIRSLLCPETDRNIRIRNQGYGFLI